MGYLYNGKREKEQTWQGLLQREMRTFWKRKLLYLNLQEKKFIFPQIETVVLDKSMTMLNFSLPRISSGIYLMSSNDKNVQGSSSL